MREQGQRRKRRVGPRCGRAESQHRGQLEKKKSEDGAESVMGRWLVAALGATQWVWGRAAADCVDLGWSHPTVGVGVGWWSGHSCVVGHVPVCTRAGTYRRVRGIWMGTG